MFPPHHFHQEIARQRHADLLREARREQLAAVVAAERERSPLVRLVRQLEARLIAPLRRHDAHAPRLANRAA
jgi:hypothetical protein